MQSPCGQQLKPSILCRRHWTADHPRSQFSTAIGSYSARRPSPPGPALARRAAEPDICLVPPTPPQSSPGTAGWRQLTSCVQVLQACLQVVVRIQRCTRSICASQPLVRSPACTDCCAFSPCTCKVTLAIDAMTNAGGSVSSISSVL